MFRDAILAGLVICGWISVSQAQLVGAVARGEIDRVKKMLEQGADVNADPEVGRPVIISAQTPKMVELLLAHGAKLEFESDSGTVHVIEHLTDDTNGIGLIAELGDA